MGTVSDNIEPDLIDVLQEDHPTPAIVVRNEGPIYTHELPTRSGGMFSTVVNDTQAESVAGSDRRRKRLWLLSVDEPMYVGNARQLVEAGAAMLIPAATGVDIYHSDQVFVRSATADTPTTVSVLVENWAD
jgi:hypothetical protein